MEDGLEVTEGEIANCQKKSHGYEVEDHFCILSTKRMGVGDSRFNP